jgi:hypothetical protein
MVMILTREKREREVVAAIQYSGIYEKLVMDR